MQEKKARRKDPFNRSEPGSFIEVSLVSDYRTYARKLKGLSGFAFYDILSIKPLTDLTAIAQQPVLLMAPLLMPEASKWPVIGHMPLEDNWPKHMLYWRAEPQPLIEESTSRLIFQPDTEFFLIEYVNNEPVYTPTKPDDLRGLARQTLYPPKWVEEKLRIHYGLTEQGERVTPTHLRLQPLW